ncbi:hypothetical protein KKF19_01410 [Patescibacteria group bacterium]|nr:hypothetical protein [Patescibacteria group bacterium]
MMKREKRTTREMLNTFVVILVIVGAFLVFGSVGGMENNFIDIDIGIKADSDNLIKGTYYSLIGFGIIAIAIFIANRKEG